MQLVVFHYHLLPGGVTDVIVNSIRAVMTADPRFTGVRLVCGRYENAEVVVDTLIKGGLAANLEVIPDIDYSPANEPLENALGRAERLQGILVQRYGTDDSVWWVHNHHVGKNPSFTLALCRISEGRNAPRMILHIHDFPECARYENLAYLTRVAGDSPYPAGDRVRYAVINARDRALLGKTEIPASRVHLLVNPLPPPEAPDAGLAGRETVVAALNRFASGAGHSFDPDRRTLLYPVRTIRRKNVLEMALLARLAGDANLVVTLPGVSDSEKSYSNLVSDTYASGFARGAWGMGRREHEYGISYSALAHSADAIVSSSVQEGFGLLFVNALRWRVPLFARDLPVLEGLETLFDGYPAHFYRQVRVPIGCPSLRSVRKDLRTGYAERLEAMRQFLPDPARARLERQLDELLAGEDIDFAFLSPEMQRAYLGDLSDSGFAAEIRSLNRPDVEALESLRPGTCPDVSARIDSMFGYEAYGARFLSLIESFGDRGGAPGVGARRYASVQSTLVEAFADLDYIRLLYSPMGS